MLWNTSHLYSSATEDERSMTHMESQGRAVAEANQDMVDRTTLPLQLSTSTGQPQPALQVRDIEVWLPA
jgi:hypothetical protein